MLGACASATWCRSSDFRALWGLEKAPGRRATSPAPFRIHTEPQGGLGPCLAVAATVRADTTLTSVVSAVKLDGNTTLTRPWRSEKIPSGPAGARPPLKPEAEADARLHTAPLQPRLRSQGGGHYNCLTSYTLHSFPTSWCTCAGMCTLRGGGEGTRPSTGLL